MAKASSFDVGFSRIFESCTTTVSEPITKTGEDEREGGRIIEEAFFEAERDT